MERIGNVVPIQKKTSASGGLRSLEASPVNLEEAKGWLRANALGRATYQIPAPSAAMIEGLKMVVVEAGQALQPADPKAYAVMMEGFVGVLQSFGISIPDMKILASTYRETLRDLPADLLEKAIEIEKRTRTYHSVPLPGELRRHVEVDLRERRNIYRAAKEVMARFGPAQIAEGE